MPSADFISHEITPAERALSNQLATEVAASGREQKPSITDMAEWAAGREREQYSTILRRTWLNRSTAPDEVRDLAVALRAVDFLVLAAEHEEDIRTLIRAKAWKAGRR